MLEKLLEIVLAAKSGALSGVLLVAGTLVTVTAGGGVTVVQLEDHPSPSPSALAPLSDPEDGGATAPERETAGQPVALRPDGACAATGEAARMAARERVSSAFVTYRNALDEVRAAHRAGRATETLEQAEAMLREIADAADRAIAEMCDDVEVLADRAVAAMETVLNLAKGAAEATPSPKPTEKPKPKATAKPTEKAKHTPKPTAKATAKPSRTPSCDDRLYEHKLKMAAAFERFHALHDKMYFAYKRTSSPLAKTVIANDELMHRTYDEAKRQILSSGCGGDMGAAAAAHAAATFERAYQSSAQAVASQGR